jgi:colanic acid biosynthesis protein WcaH
MSGRIDDDTFAVVVRNAPLVSIDLILRDPERRVFVARRNNEPAKGMFFVPGGVIRKNETLDAAFRRILAIETGLAGERSEARLMGGYEHFYSTNRYGHPAYGTHYVVLAHEVAFTQRPDIRLDTQHSEFRWMSDAEVLTSAEVHENTKAYCRR